MLQDKLVHVATTEREAAANPRSVTLRRGEGVVDQEKQRLAQRVSAGPQAALLAPLVQGAEVEPWICIRLKSRLLLCGEGVFLGTGSRGPIAGALSQWRQAGDRQPNSQVGRAWPGYTGFISLDGAETLTPGMETW